MRPDGDELRRAQDALDDLVAAEGQAQQEQVRITKEIKRLDRDAELARAGKVMDERLVLCKEITAGIDKLAPLFSKFAATAATFERLVRSGSNQVQSDWRIKAVIDEQLLFHAIAPALRVADLQEIERKIYGDVLARAVRAAAAEQD